MATTTAILLGILLVGALGISLQHMTRGTPIHGIRCIDGGEDGLRADSPMFRETFELLTNTTIYDGNRIELAFNGEDTYERLFADLKAAERLIVFHVFWFKPGQLADRLAEILVERARAGVTVLFLFDYWGSKGIKKEYRERLKEAGIDVGIFRPLSWGNLHKVQQRTHMRCVVIDSRTAWTGGFAIDDHWTGDGVHEDQWRDTNVRVQGPVVDQLLAAFSANWAEATGDLLTGKGWFQQDTEQRVGECRAGLMFGAPTVGSTNAERFFALSSAAARETLYITNAYFLPDHDFRRFLREAVDRGVDVRVLTPGENTDQQAVWYAGRAHYAELLRGGVRLYEYEPTMIHAKTIVADGMWGYVGSLNYDNRSMSLNDEVALVFWDDGLGEQLRQQYFRDLEHAREVTLESHEARGYLGRVREQLSRVIVRLL